MHVTFIEGSTGQSKAHFQRVRLFTEKLKIIQLKVAMGSQENNKRMSAQWKLIKYPWNEFMGPASQFYGKENETVMGKCQRKGVVATAHTSSQEAAA